MKKDGFLRAVRLNREKVSSFENYPFSIPVIRHLDRLPFSPTLTIIIGENGVGKSTLIEAIAVKWEFNPEGGTKNFRFSTKDTHSELKDYLVLEKGVSRATDGFFLRAAFIRWQARSTISVTFHRTEASRFMSNLTEKPF